MDVVVKQMLKLFLTVLGLISSLIGYVVPTVGDIAVFLPIPITFTVLLVYMFTIV